MAQEETLFEWIRGMYREMDDADKREAERFFPELKESEDERIRELLVWQVYRNIEDETNDLAQSVYDGIKGHDPDLEESIEDWKKCLAYLEKQKENIKKEYVFRPLAGTDINSAALQAIRRADEGDRLVLAFNGAYIPVRKGCNANKIVDIYDSFIEKQKESKVVEFDHFREQKPAQTVDEKEYIRTIKGIIADFIRDKQPEDVAFYQKIYDWLDGRHIEQKPAEWSEEDTKMLNCCIEEVGSMSIRGDVKELRDWLKDIPNRFDFLPDDVERLKVYQALPGTTIGRAAERAIELAKESTERIVLCFNDVMIPVTEYTSKKEIEESYHKCLTGGWKPSEEQMTNLINVRNHVAQASGHWCESLSSLIDDLQKL